MTTTTDPRSPTTPGTHRTPSAPGWRGVAGVVLASVAIGVATYAAAIFGDYGRLDDFQYLVGSSTGSLSGLRGFLLDSGRPVPAVLMTVVAPQIDSVGDLSWFRLVSTLMLSLLAAAAALVFLRLAPARRTPTTLVLAVVVGGVALSTTSSPSAATWAILAGALHAFPLAVLAGLLATSSRRWWWVGTAVLVLVVAFSYQQVAPIAIYAPLLWSAERWRRGETLRLGRAVVSGVVVVASLGLNFLYVGWRGGVGTERLGNVPLQERADFFLTSTLPRTLDLTIIPSEHSLLWSVVLLGVLLAAPGLLGWRHLLPSAAVLVGWFGVALAVFPLELWASFRVASAAQFMLWAGAATCFALFVTRLGRRELRVALTGALAAGAVAGLAVSAYRAEAYLAGPSERDWSAMRCAVLQTPLEPGSPVALNWWYDSTSPVVESDEYGLMVSASPRDYPFALWLATDVSVPGGRPDFAPLDLVVEPPDAVTSGALVTSPGSPCAP